jgi:hypothetical protein
MVRRLFFAIALLLLPGCVVVRDGQPTFNPWPASPVDPLMLCRNQVMLEFQTVPLADITVNPAPNDARGNAIVNWRTRGGASGFCRISPRGQLVGFVVEGMGQSGGLPTPVPSPSPSPIPSQITTTQLNRCKSRVSSEFAGLSLSAISVFPVAPDSAGNAVINWGTQTGATGLCRVDATNRVVEFRVQQWGKPPTPVPPPSPPPPPQVERSCTGMLNNLDFVVIYDSRRQAFTRVDFWRQGTNQLVGQALLNYDGQDNNGQDIFLGSVGGMADVAVVNLSRNQVYPGSQVSVKYDAAWGRGTCR